MENLISSEESTSSSESLEDQEPAEVTMSAHMEERNSEFRHMAMTGEEITEEWPPPGTPTWSQWLEVSVVTQAYRRNIHDAFCAQATVLAIFNDVISPAHRV